MNLKGMLFQQGNCSVVPPDELPVLRLVVANHRENTLHFLTVKSRSEKVVLISLPDMRTLTLESLGTALSLAIDLQDHLALRFDSDAKQALSGPLPRGAALVIGEDVCLSAQGSEDIPRAFRISDGQEVDIRTASIYYVERWTLMVTNGGQASALFSFSKESPMASSQRS